MLDPKSWALSDIFISGNSGNDCYCSLMFDPRPPTHGQILEAQYLGGQSGKKYRCLMRIKKM